MLRGGIGMVVGSYRVAIKQNARGKLDNQPPRFEERGAVRAL